MNIQRSQIGIDEIINIYKNDNWEFNEITDINDFNKIIKPNLQQSFGGNPPIFDTGYLVDIHVDRQTNSHIVFTYSSRIVEDILSVNKDRVNSLADDISTKAITFGKTEMPKNLDQLNDLIDKTREQYSGSSCIVGKIFMIEGGFLVADVNYTFLFDINKTVPLSSIVIQDENEFILLFSEEFKNKFNDKDQANYLQRVVLAAISYILEQFK